jgi:toxin secretion/phage lysis holin
MKNETIIKGFFAGLASVITYLFGGWDGLISVLVTVIIIDYATGFLCGAVTKTLSSAVGFKGIAKKIMLLAVVALGQMLDTIMGNTNMIRDAAIYAFIANEGLSIIENAAILDVPFVRPLKDMLEQLRDKDGDKG